VAGLAALGAAKALGAEVRAFDTRAAAREQVESLGGKFLTVEVKESGEGQGGYAKQMSKEFIEAEHALFKAQAADVSVVITTALVPGAKAPVLMTKEVIAAYRPGTVMVDMAAEQGGNCEGCNPGEIADVNGVQIIGFTDLASRMANTASKFFATNLVHLLEEMGGGKGFKIDLENDVIRPALLTHKGESLPPPAVKEPTAIAPKPAAAPAPVKAEEAKPEPEKPDPSNTVIAAVAALFALFMIGKYAPADFLAHATVFVLACFVGWQVVWAVTPALHTPLMSVTNAISGIIIVGGMLQIANPMNSDGRIEPATVLGAAAVLLAAINIAGGFAVTQRMLKMFHREAAPSSSKGGH
jgi:NAD(P) transhydrogenase subunit alpha